MALLPSIEGLLASSPLQHLSPIVSNQSPLFGFPTSSSVHEVRSFRGPATFFYRRFISKFTIATSLTNCLKPKSFVWPDEAQESFQLLKRKLTEAPILALPNSNKISYLPIKKKVIAPY